MFHNGLKASLNSHPYSFTTRFYYICSSFSSVMSEPGGPIFGRSVNPIPSGEGQIIPTYYNCPPPKKKDFFTYRHHCSFFYNWKGLYWRLKWRVVFILPFMNKKGTKINVQYVNFCPLSHLRKSLASHCDRFHKRKYYNAFEPRAFQTSLWLGVRVTCSWKHSKLRWTV